MRTGGSIAKQALGCRACAAYKTLAAAALGEAITLAFCWAHLRRRFFDLAKAATRRSLAELIGTMPIREFPILFPPYFIPLSAPTRFRQT